MKKTLYPCLFVLMTLCLTAYTCEKTTAAEDPPVEEPPIVYEEPPTVNLVENNPEDTCSPAPEERENLSKTDPYLEPDLPELDLAKDLMYFSYIERYLLLEINRIRANPVEWVKEVGLYGGEVQMWADALPAGYSLPPLTPSKGLWLAARWWSSEQKRINDMSHANMNSRFSTYGTWNGYIGENCAPPDIWEQASGPAWKDPDEGRNARVVAARIVNEFIRDRGVSDKGHRKNIMSESFRYIGLAFVDGWVTMEFAQGYTDKPEAAATDVWECPQ